MAKAKAKPQELPIWEDETGFVANMKAAAIKHADNNLLFEIALKHFHCDNPSPTAVEDAINELDVRLTRRLVQSALRVRAS